MQALFFLCLEGVLDPKAKQFAPMAAFVLYVKTSWDRLSSGVRRVMGAGGMPEVYVNSGAQVAPRVGRFYRFTQTLSVRSSQDEMDR